MGNSSKLLNFKGMKCVLKKGYYFKILLWESFVQGDPFKTQPCVCPSLKNQCVICTTRNSSDTVL